MRTMLITLAFLAGVATGEAGDGAPATPSPVGVLVEQTRGADQAQLRAARAEVQRIRARGADAQLRVTRSPSESVAAAATLVARGAGRLVTYGVTDPALLGPLRDRAAIRDR